MEFKKREEALKLNDKGLDEFDFTQSKITSLMQPTDLKATPEVAPPIHESINCDFGVTYTTEI